MSGDRGQTGPAGGEWVDEPVDAERMHVIDAEQGGGARLYAAMRDQEHRAQAFERKVRWMRLRGVLRADGGTVIDLRDAEQVTPS